jgi:class 3 adenylate cyclase
MQDYLAKFVPQSVKRLVETNPEALELDKREQDVSVLFVDISGYTRLSETFSQERMNFIVERYFSSFLDCISANEGDINETAGDGVMVIFADTDPQGHARKAVQTALEIMHRAMQLNAQFRETFVPIYVHIGINSGLALVGATKLEGANRTRWTYTASGPVTNMAARIAALAEGGMILIGPETAQRLRGLFPMQTIGQHQLRNMAEKVLIYRILGPAEA